MINCQLWKPVIGYEDCYLVSDQGNIKRIKKARACTFIGKILKPDTTQRGYLRYTLCDQRRLIRMMAHHLVMFNFVGPMYPTFTINHKDANPLNNSVYNLEYVTQRENCYHALKMGLCSTVGVTHHDAKLDRTKVDEIIHLFYTTNITHRELAKIYNVTKSTITSVINGRTWKVY